MDLEISQVNSKEVEKAAVTRYFTVEEPNLLSNTGIIFMFVRNC